MKNLKDKLFLRASVILYDVADYIYNLVSVEYIEEKAEELIAEANKIMNPTYLYGVVVGPIHRDSIPDDEGAPDELEWMMVLKSSKDGKTVEDITLWFETFEETQQMLDHFHKTVEPLKVYLDA